MSSSEATQPTSSSPTATSPPSPPTSPPTDSTPPPSPPADATSPPPPHPPPSPTPSPPISPPPAPPTSSPPPPAPPTSSPPPPAPPTSSPPPPVSTPSTSPPPPAKSKSPPPPVASASPPPPVAVPSPPTPTATPSTPPPATDAAPVQNPPPQTADPPPTPANSPPQPKESSGETPSPPQSLTPSRSRSPSVSHPAAGAPLTPSPSNHNSTLPGGVIAGIIGGVVVIIGLLMVIICLVCKRRKKKPNYYMDPNGANQYYNQDPSQWRGQHPMDPSMKLHPPAGSFMGAPVSGWGAQPYSNSSGEFSTGHSSGQHPTPPSQSMGGMTHFSYEDLAAATNGFSQANLLGQGGFGLVHKGVLPDGKEVAVKSLKSGSGQGEREFQAEVEIISRVHHRHLVSLVGYCIAYEKKLLVYEFVANKTLEFHLYGKDQPVMEWPTRLRIAVGSAKGLAYLHEDCLPRIIHRDIKAANILLDSNYEAMVADFGLAKLTTDNNTHVSTRVMGTFGYLAPEYASSGKLSEKSDVFSFGVMLLELVTGRKPIDMTNMMEDSLVDWARPLLSKALEDGNFDELVDPRLEGRYVHQELSCMAACAAASIRHSARKRPKMSQIVRALEGDSSLDNLNEGVKPGQSAIYNPNGGSGMYDTRAYNADMMKFKKMVMASGEFDSSEYENTSEYGLNPSVSSTDSGYSRETEKTSRN